MSVDSQGVRTVTREEVALRIDEEVKLVCLIAAKYPEMPTMDAVYAAYRLIDEAIKQQQERAQTAMNKEYRRRRGH